MWGEAGTEPARLVPMPAGRGYRIASAPDQAMVTPELAGELKRVLETFAAGSGFSDEQPVGVFFKPGIFGHHKVGRAADIYGVGGAGLDRWKARWDAAPSDAERRTNLGWRLYRTMATEGRWSQPYGYPIQLFGPWTRSEGPWKYISDRLLHAHRDHIHVAK
jgi:hypothetical protein